jgi:hypothetical protein
MPGVITYDAVGCLPGSWAEDGPIKKKIIRIEANSFAGAGIVPPRG